MLGCTLLFPPFLRLCPGQLPSTLKWGVGGWAAAGEWGGSRNIDSGLWLLHPGFWVLGSRCWVLDSGFYGARVRWNKKVHPQRRNWGMGWQGGWEPNAAGKLRSEDYAPPLQKYVSHYFLPGMDSEIWSFSVLCAQRAAEVVSKMWRQRCLGRRGNKRVLAK